MIFAVLLLFAAFAMQLGSEFEKGETTLFTYFFTIAFGVILASTLGAAA